MTGPNNTTQQSTIKCHSAVLEHLPEVASRQKMILFANTFVSLWIALAVKNSLPNAREKRTTCCLTDDTSTCDMAMCMYYTV